MSRRPISELSGIGADVCREFVQPRGADQIYSVLLPGPDQARRPEGQAEPVRIVISPPALADCHSNSDAYHTCYVLAGLSSAQNNWHLDPSMAPVSGPLGSAYQWRAEAMVEADQIYDEGDRVGTVHPVFVVPEGVAERTRVYYESRGWR
jgi:hypothetical protein